MNNFVMRRRIRIRGIQESPLGQYPFDTYDDAIADTPAEPFQQSLAYLRHTIAAIVPDKIHACVVRLTFFGHPFGEEALMRIPGASLAPTKHEEGQLP